MTTAMKTNTETRNFKEVTVSTVTLPDGRIETIIFYNGCEVKEMSKLSTVIGQHNAAVKFCQKSKLTVEGLNVYLV